MAQKQTRFTLQELDIIFAKYKKLAEQKDNLTQTVYDTFIEEMLLKQKSKQKSKPLPGNENHHIVPKHMGGSNASSNLVTLTVEEHIVAHYILAKECNSYNDEIAYVFRNAISLEIAQIQLAKVKLARKNDQIHLRGFFSSKFQAEQGKKGGKVGGTKNTLAQTLARAKVGQTYGRQTGLANQSSTMGEFLSKYAIWAFSPAAALTPHLKDRGKEIFVLVSPQQGFIDVVRILNRYSNNNIKSPASMYKLVAGERKQMYGWRIERMLTRSEVAQGIQEFEFNYPNTDLNISLNLETEELNEIFE